MKKESQSFEVEMHGIEPIPESDRSGDPKSLFGMWWGGQFTYISLVIGSLPILLGLSLWAGLSAVLVGGVLGSIFVGLSGVLGPKTGTATIVNTRSVLGIKGNVIPEVLNWVTVVGWAASNSVLGALALIQLFGMIGWTGVSVKIVSVIIILSIQIVIAMVGLNAVMSTEKVFAVISTVLVFGMVIFLLPKMDWNYGGAGLTGKESIGTWFLAVAIVFTGPLSWVNYASDYTRYYAKNTSSKRIILWAGGGMLIATMLSYPIGSLLATVVDMGDPIANLPKILPTWYLAPFLFVVFWSCIANNVLNVYTAGLALLTLRIKVKRIVSVSIIGVLAMIFCYFALFVYNFVPIFQQFLLLQMLWLAPWCVLMLTDYKLRKGEYEPQSLHHWGEGEYWYSNGFNGRGIAVFFISIIVSLPFANSELFHTRLATDILGGADISFFVGMIAAFVLYSLVGGVNKNYQNRQV